MKNANQLSQYLSTGNKLVDILGGGLYGFNANNQKKGYYLPTFNYTGNGLARGGLQYYSNPNYVNPYDAAQATSSVLNNQKFGNFIDSLKQRFQKPGRHSTLDKGHEEGGSAYANAGSSLRSPPGYSRASQIGRASL